MSKLYLWLLILIKNIYLFIYLLLSVYTNRRHDVLHVESWIFSVVSASRHPYLLLSILFYHLFIYFIIYLIIHLFMWYYYYILFYILIKLLHFPIRLLFFFSTILWYLLNFSLLFNFFFITVLLSFYGTWNRGISTYNNEQIFPKLTKKISANNNYHWVDSMRLSLLNSILIQIINYILE